MSLFGDTIFLRRIPIIMVVEDKLVTTVAILRQMVVPMEMGGAVLIVGRY